MVWAVELLMNIETALPLHVEVFELKILVPAPPVGHAIAIAGVEAKLVFSSYTTAYSNFFFR